MYNLYTLEARTSLLRLNAMHYQPTSAEVRFIDRVRSVIREEVSGGVWIVALPVLARAVALAEDLLNLGATRVLAVGASRGVGMPDLISPQIEMLCLDLKVKGDMMDGIRAAERALDELPEYMLDSIELFDPSRQARVMRNIFSTSDRFADRAVFGCRPPSWVMLEDKLLIDAFWDAADVQRAPSMITSLTLASLSEAFKKLNKGDGVVIAGDNRSGWHGGASRTRWARSEAHIREIVESLGTECDQARVMPLLKGVSCSIHGWVSSEQSVSIRPCEMLVYESPDHDTYFDYAGAATNWIPSAHIAEQMHKATLRAADHLRDQYGYRGTFTIDGIATDDHFYPTELNPRFGGALARMIRVLPDLPLLFLHYMMVDADASQRASVQGLDLTQLASLIIRAADASPYVAGMASLSLSCVEERHFHYRYVDQEWRLISRPGGSPEIKPESTAEDLTPDEVLVKWGPSTFGSIVICQFNNELFARGVKTIDLVSRLLIRAQRDIVRVYGTDFG